MPPLDRRVRGERGLGGVAAARRAPSAGRGRGRRRAARTSRAPPRRRRRRRGRSRRASVPLMTAGANCQSAVVVRRLLPAAQQRGRQRARSPRRGRSASIAAARGILERVCCGQAGVGDEGRWAASGWRRWRGRWTAGEAGAVLEAIDGRLGARPGSRRRWRGCRRRAPGRRTRRRRTAGGCGRRCSARAARRGRRTARSRRPGCAAPARSPRGRRGRCSTAESKSPCRGRLWLRVPTARRDRARPTWPTRLE